MSVVAQYRGNSSPGQLADSSGNGYTLTVVGTSVPNPSTPTPPEGNRWLVGPSTDGESHLAAPTAVATALAGRGSIEGDFISSLGTEPNRAVDDVLFSFNGAPLVTGTKFFGVMDSTAPFGQIRMYFFQLLPTVNTSAFNFVDAGSLHHFKYEWDATGTRLYLDSVLRASTSVQPTIPTFSPTIAGNDYPGSSHAMDYGYMDNVIFDNGEVAGSAPLLPTPSIELGALWP